MKSRKRNMTEPIKRAGTRIRPVGAALILVLSMMSVSFSDAPLVPPASHPLAARWVLGIDDRRIEQYATVQVQPVYPLAAQKYRIEGTVSVEVVVKDETVVKASFVRGHSVFKLVSLEAARQWRFRLPDGGENDRLYVQAR
jgi:outer membrane biosynthesis protein TonB